MSGDIPERVYLCAAVAYEAAIDDESEAGKGFGHPDDVLALFAEERANQPAFRATVASVWVAHGDATLDRAKAKVLLHPVLHDLNVRIVGLDVGDCHCNLVAEVVLDALAGVAPVVEQVGDGRG